MLDQETLDSLYADLGHRIRQARLASQLTPHALGTLIGLSRPSVVNLEAGRQRAPIHTLWRIAETLNISVKDLLPEVNRAIAMPSVVNKKLRQEDRLRTVSQRGRVAVKRFLESQLAPEHKPLSQSVKGGIDEDTKQGGS